MHRVLHRISCLAASVVLLLGLSPVSEAADRPNIVFIQTDDQAPWALGLVNHQAKTPHMDQLFREGAYLVHSFTTTPVCSPSRASLMTSRYGSELGITDWIHPRREPDLGLDPKHLTFPEVLQKAGYTTGLVGKWHLGLPDRFHPTRTGFDYFMGHRAGGWSTANPTLEKKGQSTKMQGLTTDILCDDAIAFVRKYQKETFFLAWHTRAPHTRWLPVADEDWAPFESMDPVLPNPDYPDLNTKRAKRMMREYLASVRGVDRNLGRFLKVLDDLDLSSKTVVIFTSDHGYSMAHNGIWHKGNGHWLLNKNPAATKNIPNGQRPNMYDNSIRIPTAVRWPGKIKPRTVITETVSNMDWYPSVLAMAGLKLPEKTLIRGRNIVPLLTGTHQGSWNNDFYAEYSTKHQSQTHMRMYRTREWKLVRDFLNPERDELYHLKEDPAEMTNLINDKRPEIRGKVQELHAKILNQMKKINDPVLNHTKTRRN